MNRKRLGFILIGAGVALAFVVGALVYLQVRRAQEAIAALPNRAVVVASENVPARSQIKASQVQLVRVPDQAIPPNAAGRIDETVVGKYTPSAILKGQVILTSQIGDVATKGVPSYQLQPGRVLYAMETELPNQQSPALTKVNALRSGDRIDLIYSTMVLPPEIAASADTQTLRGPGAAQYLQTRVLLQNIPIDRLGIYKPDGTFQENDKFMLFMVSPEEALVLKWVKDAAGFYGNSIEFILRAPSDQQPVDTNLIVNLNYMRDKYGLPAPVPVLPTASR